MTPTAERSPLSAWCKGALRGDPASPSATEPQGTGSSIPWFVLSETMKPSTISATPLVTISPLTQHSRLAGLFQAEGREVGKGPWQVPGPSSRGAFYSVLEGLLPRPRGGCQAGVTPVPSSTRAVPNGTHETWPQGL